MLNEVQFQQANRSLYGVYDRFTFATPICDDFHSPSLSDECQHRGMERFLNQYMFYAKQSVRLLTIGSTVKLIRIYHSGSNEGFNYSDSYVCSSQKIGLANVGIFWDLGNKPPKSLPPYEAALKLKAAASSFGIVNYMVAYATHHAFTYVPPVVKEQRKDRKVLNQLEKRGVIQRVGPCLCRVCGRKFYTNEKLINHFKQIHETEHKKRLNRIESARGSKRIQLVGKFAMKMEKYKNAARDILTPKVGYRLADELKRAGFWVRAVADKPQSADIALRNHMVNMMDHERMDCLVLVSNDSDFVDILREARLRCLKTVVVGDTSDGILKRYSDAEFSWEELMLGKIKKEAVSVVGRWKDHDILKKLEWTYNAELEKSSIDFDPEDCDYWSDHDGTIHGLDDNFLHEKDDCAWWDLDSGIENTSSND